MSNIIGKKFNKLTVIKRVENDKYRHTCYLCKCDCGNYCKVSKSKLLQGQKSCGCSHKKRWSGLSHQYNKLYKVWIAVLQRCEKPNRYGYKYYGGRGIKVCEEWHDFKIFLEWSLNNGYKDNLTIDRINVNGNYEPNNCRWVNMKTQSNNRRSNHEVFYKNKRYTIRELSEAYKIPYETLRFRINKGWSIEKAIHTPIRRYKK